jgi:hypothetical protein
MIISRRKGHRALRLLAAHATDQITRLFCNNAGYGLPRRGLDKFIRAAIVIRPRQFAYQDIDLG